MKGLWSGFGAEEEAEDQSEGWNELGIPELVYV